MHHLRLYFQSRYDAPSNPSAPQPWPCFPAAHEPESCLPTRLRQSGCRLPTRLRHSGLSSADKAAAAFQRWHALTTWPTLPAQCDSTLHIFVKDLNGQTHTVSVEPSEPLAVLEDRLPEGRFPWRRYQQHGLLLLNWAGQRLLPDYTFSDTEMKSGSTIHIYLSMVGGGGRSQGAKERRHERRKAAAIARETTFGICHSVLV